MLLVSTVVVAGYEHPRIYYQLNAESQYLLSNDRYSHAPLLAPQHNAPHHSGAPHHGAYYHDSHHYDMYGHQNEAIKTPKTVCDHGCCGPPFEFDDANFEEIPESKFHTFVETEQGYVAWANIGSHNICNMTGLSESDRSLYAPNVLFPLKSTKWKFITSRDHHHSISFPDGTKWVTA